jgi:hypothetical protein
MARSNHAFSIVMVSKKHVKQVSLSDNVHQSVLLEGNLGRLERIGLIEGVMLEIEGSCGILRIDLTRNELEQVFSHKP